MDRVSLANEELKRGIDEQAGRHNGHLVVTGLISAASVATVAQMFAVGVGDTWIRWIVGVICGTSLVASVAVWTRFQSYDVSPTARLSEASLKEWTEVELVTELVVRRFIAYRENERQLNDRWNVAVYHLAIGAGVLSTLWSLAVAVGVPAP